MNKQGSAFLALVMKIKGDFKENILLLFKGTLQRGTKNVDSNIEY